MRRRIVGFHRDQEGDWVAELDCLHTQHVRHRPPFEPRPWVTSREGRAGRLGTEIDCPLCDRAEPPDGLTPARTAGPFDETTLPAGLRRTHRAPAGAWACLRVLDGSVGFSMDTTPRIDRHLGPGETQPIPPQVDHRLRLAGPVRLQLDFFTRPEGRGARAEPPGR